MLAVLLLALAAFCASNSVGDLGEHVHLCGTSPIAVMGPFVNISTGAPAPQPATAHMCHRDPHPRTIGPQFFRFSFDVTDSDQVYEKAAPCNSDVAVQGDAVGVLVDSTFFADPEMYLSIFVNPVGVFSVSQTKNQDGNCQTVVQTPVQACNAPELLNVTAESHATGYNVQIDVALALVPPGQFPPDPEVWRVQFVRVDASSDGKPSVVSSWKETFISPACWDVPSQMGSVMLFYP